MLQSYRALKMSIIIGESNYRYDSVKGNTGGSDVFIVYSNKKALKNYLLKQFETDEYNCSNQRTDALMNKTRKDYLTHTKLI